MSRNQQDSGSGRRPSHNVYQVVETGDRDKPEKWILVGVAWPGANDSYSIVVDAHALPSAGRWRGKYVLQVRASGNGGSSDR